jgi:cof family hydrolase
MLCTGRSLPEVYDFLWDLGFSGIVAANGSYVKIGEQVVVDNRIPAELVPQVSKFLEESGGTYVWQSPDKVNASDGAWRVFGFATEEQVLAAARGENGHDWEKQPASHGGNWQAYIRQVLPYVQPGLPTDPNKVTFTLAATSPVTLDDMRERWGDYFEVVDGSYDPGNGSRGGEIVLKGNTKASGMLAAAKYLGVGIDQVVAIGDSSNDLEVLEAAGLGICMGNGTAAAKAAANWISTDIHDGGLANALRYAGAIS